MVIPIGEKVRVFRNLTRKTYSVQHYVTGKGWRLLGHTDDITLEVAEFKVYEAGRQRTLTKGRKFVHAYIVGTVVHTAESVPSHIATKVCYNPHKMATFQTESGRQVHWAAKVYASPAGVWAMYPSHIEEVK